MYLGRIVDLARYLAYYCYAANTILQRNNASTAVLRRFLATKRKFASKYHR